MVKSKQLGELVTVSDKTSDNAMCNANDWLREGLLEISIVTADRAEVVAMTSVPPSGVWSGFYLQHKGQSRKRCTSVPPRARLRNTTGSNPKVPLKNLLYWSDCEDTNC